MSHDNAPNSESIQAIAAEIECYMKQRPNSAETLEGITHWWLQRHHIRRQLAIVERALAVLVEKGVVRVRTNRAGERLYLSRPPGPAAGPEEGNDAEEGDDGGDGGTRDAG